MFIGLCIIVIVENKRPTWCHLLFLFHFLCAQHVSDINISIIRSLRLFCWITTLVVCCWFEVCWCFGVVGLVWYLRCRLKPATQIVVSSWWWIYLCPKHVERIRSEIKMASDIKLTFCFELIKQSIYYSASSFYTFRVSTTPIIRSAQNCNYSFRYWSYFLRSYQPPSNVAKLAWPRSR